MPPEVNGKPSCCLPRSHWYQPPPHLRLAHNGSTSYDDHEHELSLGKVFVSDLWLSESSGGVLPFQMAGLVQLTPMSRRMARI